MQENWNKRKHMAHDIKKKHLELSESSWQCESTPEYMFVIKVEFSNSIIDILEDAVI